MDVERIVNQCIKQLKKLPPVLAVQHEASNNRNNDLNLELKTENGDVRFEVEVKGILKRPVPAHLTVTKHGVRKHFLLMAEYINSSIAEDLKENKINFIDCVGNAFFHIPEKIYAEIFGRKPEQPNDKKISAFAQPKGLQVLFLFLADEKSLSDTYRTLSQKAGISLDRAFAVRNELVDKGYVYTSDKKHYRFIDKRELLERWLTNYGDRLRPKLVLGSFKIPPSIEERIPGTLFNNLTDEKEFYAIGGGLGADILLHYYRGPTTELFIKPNLLEKLKTVLKLGPAKETNVTLMNLFSPHIIFREDSTFPVAHPLLIYAELLYQGGGRAKETAEMIYNKYLKQNFDAD